MSENMPEDATPAMIKAALDVDWTNEDERATAHNVWHAMFHAYLRERPITERLKKSGEGKS